MTHAEMAALTDGLPSKSEKIRKLATSGVATAAIADFLGIRYQFAYNVIKRAGLGERGAGDEAQAGATAEAGATTELPTGAPMAEPTLEDFIRVAHAKGFTVTFHPLKGPDA